MSGFFKNPIKYIKSLGQQLFAKFFGFEQGIDITDDVEVLHRRNVVIKNIVFISNLVYSSLLFILSISGGNSSDWFISAISLPLTYLINKLLSKLMHGDAKDKTKQSLAAYVSAFYIFFSSFLIYLRLHTGEFETVAYILIYYAIVVISLYQDKKMLSTSFQFILVLVTIMHLTVTYNVGSQVDNKTIIEFLRYFVKQDAFRDLVLRTFVFVLFYFVVYAIVSIGQYMQEERKKELIKRRAVQSDFVQIVGDLFNAVFVNSVVLVNKKHALQVQRIALKLADFYGFNNEKKADLNDFSMVHLKYDEVRSMTIDAQNFDEKAYNTLKHRTALGALIVKRIELSQKSESIVRSHLENTADDDFINEIKKSQLNMQEQIILLSDVYVTLRSPFSYKRPLPHSQAMRIFENQLSGYFHYELKERFIRFADEFEALYNNFDIR